MAEMKIQTRLNDKVQIRSGSTTLIIFTSNIPVPFPSKIIARSRIGCCHHCLWKCLSNSGKCTGKPPPGSVWTLCDFPCAPSGRSFCRKWCSGTWAGWCPRPAPPFPHSGSAQTGRLQQVSTQLSNFVTNNYGNKSTTQKQCCGSGSASFW
jgi:hypothetical protein